MGKSNIETNKCPLISVILPVYNTADYLSECINSVLNQTYKNIELIIINDGSTDGSSKIIADKAKDPRVVSIEKENSGQSDCRKLALTLVRGDYVYFIDSDDYLEMSSLEIMYNNISKYDADICCCRFRLVDLCGKELKVSKCFTTDIIDSNEEIINDALCTRNIKAALWTRLYKTDFIKRNNVQTLSNLLHDDFYFSLRAAIYAKRAICCNDILYNVRQRPNSVSRSISNKGLLAYQFIFDNIRKELQSTGLYESHRGYFYGGYIKCLLFSLVLLAVQSNNYKHFSGFYQSICNTEYETVSCADVQGLSHRFLLAYKISLHSRIFYYMLRLIHFFVPFKGI